MEKIPKPSFEQPISKEQIEGRVKIFESEKSWQVVRKFALEYRKLKPEILPANFDSIGDFVDQIHQEVGRRVKEFLPPALRSSDFGSDEEKEVLLKSIAGRHFMDIEEENKELFPMALVLSSVAERARVVGTAESLKKLDQSELDKFGMGAEERDVLADLLNISLANNPEYIRFKARAMAGKVDDSEKFTDSLREERRMFLGLEKIQNSIRASSNEGIKVFGLDHEAFAQYLEILKEAYRPFKENGETYTVEEKKQKAEAVRKFFVKLVKEHPDLPLLILPRTEIYVDPDLGFDPELRILWRDKKRIGESGDLVNFRDSFVELARCQFGEGTSREDLELVKSVEPVVCDDVGAFGVNIYSQAEAQTIGTDLMVFYQNIRSNESTPKEKITLKKVFGEGHKDFIDSPEYNYFSTVLVELHELAHFIYPDNGRAVKNIGEKLETKISEAKSDIIARAFYQGLLAEKAKERFGDDANVVLNIAMIGDAFRILETFSSRGDDHPYFLGAVLSLNALADQGFFIENKDGQLSVDENKLRGDFSWIFLAQAKEILSFYKKADSDSKRDIAEARKKIKELDATKPNRIIARLRKQLKITKD